MGLQKGVQATKEAFSPQKRTSSTSKDEILLTVFCFLDHLSPLGSGSGSMDPIESGSDPDPDLDPQHCELFTSGTGSLLPIISLNNIHEIICIISDSFHYGFNVQQYNFRLWI
jgi:hypothetical protein